MTTLSRQASDSDDVLPTTPPSEPRVLSAQLQRHAIVAEQVARLTSEPVLAGSLMGDLLALQALKDAIGAIEAARAAVIVGDRDGFRVELRMAIRCAEEALKAQNS